MVPGEAARVHRHERRRLTLDARFGLVLLAPAATIITIVVIVPIAFAVVMAFLRVDLTRSADWTFFGTGNFEQVARDPQAAKAVVRSLVFCLITVVGTCVLALLVALFLNDGSVATAPCG